jgi:hypothetical protein
VYGSPKLIRGLCGHYDTEKWDEMNDLWKIKVQHWWEVKLKGAT